MASQSRSRPTAALMGAAFMASPVPTAILNQGGGFEVANEAFKVLFGSGADEVREAVGHEGLARIIADCVVSEATGTAYHTQDDVLTVGERAFQWQVVPLDQGARLLTLHECTTEEHLRHALQRCQETVQSQRQAHEEQEHYVQDVLEALGHPVMVGAASGRGVYAANQAWMELFDTNPQEAFSTSAHYSFLNNLPPDAKQGIVADTPRLMAGELIHQETAFDRPDGTQAHVQATYKLLPRRPHWKVNRLVASFVDITALHEREQHARRQAQLVVDVLDAAAAPLAVVDVRE